MRRVLVLAGLAGCAQAAVEVGKYQQALGQGQHDGLDLESSHPSGYRWRFDHSETPNHSTPPAEPNRTAHLGWNVDQAGMPLDASEPSWRVTWEANFEKSPGGPHLFEWHVQGTHPVHGTVRPLGVAVDRDAWQSLGVRVQGRFMVADGAANVLDMKPATGRWNLGLGAVGGAGVAVVHNNPGVPIVSARASDRYVDVMRINGADELELGNRAERVRFLTWDKPVATNCEELGQALDAMGLVSWQP